MKILILEDNEKKLALVNALIKDEYPAANITEQRDFFGFLRSTEREVFDLIIADLIVLPRCDSAEPEDLTNELINQIRDHRCKNFRTPVVALTAFEAAAEENFKDLNQKDITVVTFSEHDEEWRNSLREKIRSCVPPEHFDFVVICALAEEAEAFRQAGYTTHEQSVLSGLNCIRIQIGNRRGVVVTQSRMGLVSAAITSIQAIERFNPSLICMSGICGGSRGKARIYDVVIPEICHQNDAGKWTSKGFEPEIYSVQLDHETRLKIQNLISRGDFLDSVKKDIHLEKSEFPENSATFEFNILLAPSSSGSAVVAQEEASRRILEQHRKLHSFEMESFAIYEAARLSRSKPKYFSAKSVVDDGTPSKGDNFHRVACLLSAKVIYGCIAAGIFDA